MSPDVTQRSVSPVRLNMSAVEGRSLTEPTRSVTERPRAGGIVLVAPIAGAALGVVARGWMRLITDDPEFTWDGTIFIALAFTITGAAHGLAWAVRRAGARRRWSTPTRIVAAAMTLPLFTGAGALMLPTVVGATLAGARTDWPRPVRVIPAALAIPVPVLIAADLVERGITPPTVLGGVLLAATYAVIVRSLYAVAAPIDDGWRMHRGLRTLTVIATVLLVLVAASFAVGIASAGA